MMNELGEEIGRGPKCEDCGNQAKKGCDFMRCRTCCNAKGFRCQIHIPSPRKRLLLQHNPQTHTQINPSSGVHKINKLPAAIRSTAMFRCVRVQSRDDAVNEYAYQTTVNIGGRVFSGVLYDQGPPSQSQSQSFYGSQSSTGGDASVTMAPLLSASANPFSSSSSSPYPLSFHSFQA